jgi:hypothetical protein
VAKRLCSQVAHEHYTILSTIMSHMALHEFSPRMGGCVQGVAGTRTQQRNRSEGREKRWSNLTHPGRVDRL